MQGKRLWAASVAAVLIVLSANAASACDGKKALFEDKFTAWNTAWGSPADNVKTAGGKMTLSLGANDSVGHMLNQSNAYGDSNFCVTVRFAATAEPVNTVAGLAFWGTDDTHYWFLGISGNGMYSVQHKISDSRFLTPVPWTQDAAIKPGAGEQHDLEVRMKGGEATVFVDGKQLAQVNGQAPDGGALIGVYWSTTAAANAVLEFSNFKVMQ